jgi:hypothetical protein
MLPEGIHVFKGYKIHEDQIANIARNLKEHCHTRRHDSQQPSHSRRGNVKQTNGKTGNALCVRIRKTVWETGPVEEPVINSQKNLLPRMETPGRAVTAVRCFRCGVDFPVADFLYTKKSGLCIDCWEEMVL